MNLSTWEPNAAPDSGAARTERRRSRWTACAAAIVVTVIIAAFLGLKLYALTPHLNDDGIYFYAAVRITEGTWPYRDFFHAHPPLHVLPTALAFAIWGYSFALGKAVVFCFAAVQGVCAYLSVRRLVSRTSAPIVRELAAVGAAAVLLFGSGTFLVASSDDTGLMQSGTWLAVAFVLLVHNWSVLAGIFAGIAAMTSLQVVPLAAAMVLWAFADGDRARTARTAAGLLTVLVAVHIWAVAFAGRAFFEQVYAFHLAKQGVAQEGARELVQLARHNWPLWMATVSGLAAAVRAKHPTRRLVMGMAASILVYLVFIGSRPRVFYWYFVPCLFPAVVIAGTGWASMITAAGRDRTWRQRRWREVLGLATATLIATIGHPRPAAALRSPHHRRPYDQQRKYDWRDAEFLGPVNAVIRAVLWQDGRRPEEPTPRPRNHLTEYLWRQSTGLATHGRMVAAVARYACGGSVELLGDYAAVPLMALDAGVPVVDHEVDTTGQRLAAGFASIGRLARSGFDGASRPIVVLRTDGSGLNADRSFRAHVENQLPSSQTFVTDLGVEHRLFYGLCSRSLGSESKSSASRGTSP